mmetsp:Transcript_6234/g.563  ORF Transcript_6234/g.563 Transcript_6234/m.563 type:complete len:113 (+) Transcript_6234:142-480(+)
MYNYMFLNYNFHFLNNHLNKMFFHNNLLLFFSFHHNHIDFLEITPNNFHNLNNHYNNLQYHTILHHIINILYYPINFNRQCYYTNNFHSHIILNFNILYSGEVQMYLNYKYK